MCEPLCKSLQFCLVSLPDSFSILVFLLLNLKYKTRMDMCNILWACTFNTYFTVVINTTVLECSAFAPSTLV